VLAWPPKTALGVSQDFNRDKRLLTPKHFKTVFDSPTGKVPGKNLLLLARDNDLGHPRIGLVIGKKSVKLSVQRNRLKRVMRDSFRLHQELLAGWDIVIVARKGLGDVENPELHQHLIKIWKRLARSRPAAEASTVPEGVDSQDA
jgi:ribonuclease P protein component